ncbi:putative NBD/HSP70 family sugar kinase [Cryobacterium mesophilum]|uniref:ROK family transcriptional regulator n=1 Tax=Terrimesophilobacter mesophilus TaxID=433647 RepID=A0A4R8V9T7_9MICO|nr:ROK family transcriptional regulator [Terrimesophilobacter mesophilus]MBB5632838.1 putative NBD/HSP70 family sugar kinase [Terrimesophilobacter mesophilus]TFB79619.1 ROK family transcriptional regulator [Terrimesophilobacter mesophilus]
MTAAGAQRSLSPTSATAARGPGIADHTTQGFSSGRALRPSAKILPEHARSHNRSLVLQTLYRAGQQSRADIARSTGLTRVTISDLVGEFISEGLIVETGQREDARPGKPATLLDINRSAFQIVGIDLSDYAMFRGALLDLDGGILEHREVTLAGSTGADAAAKVVGLVGELLALATSPILGIGVGSPGVVDFTGTVLSAPNLGWTDVPLQRILLQEFSLPVVVGNDANAAVLAEHSFGGADRDMMLVKVGHGVGAGLLVGGTPLYGSRFAAGEIGHVVVGTDGGLPCVCGKNGCLETWLAAPRLEAALAAARANSASTDDVLAEAGRHLGISLAAIVGALNLAEIVLSGPTHLLDGPLAAATIETLRNRTMAQFHGDLTLRMTTLGEDIVVRGAAVMVLSAQLGVS